MTRMDIGLKLCQARIEMGEIREIRPGEAPILADLWLEASKQAHSFIPLSYWESQKPFVESCFLKPEVKTLVWDSSGCLMGFLSLLNEEWIGALFVSPNYQGQGIGGSLLEACKEKSSQLALAVYTENSKACSFYERHGFQTREERMSQQPPHLERVYHWNRER